MLSLRDIKTFLAARVASHRWWNRVVGRAEEGCGYRLCQPHFPSPLIKPDVPISGIRLSDWLRLRHTAVRQGEPGIA